MAVPRPPRLHVPGGHYHVTLRGNHRSPIFDDASDRSRWEDILARAIAKTGTAVHAYCWMTNHVHLLVQVGDAPLAGLVRRLASGYARWYQRRVPTTGHLFERRYGARIVLDDSYLLSAVRYVHRNPLDARIVADLMAYPWSSHVAYATGRTPPWLTTRFVLGLFHEDIATARGRYLAFMAEEPALHDGTVADIELACSAAVPAAAQGSSRLEDLAIRLAAKNGLTLAMLRSESRRRSVSRVRALVAWQAISTGAGTVTDVARLLGRSAPAIAQAMDRLRRAEPGLVALPCRGRNVKTR